MTRETKIGLLVGLAFIIVIGILLSDHLTSATDPPQAALVQAGNNVRSGVAVPGGATSPVTQVQVPAHVAPQMPVATSQELRPQQPPVTVVQVGPAGTVQNSQQTPPQQPQQIASNQQANSTVDSNAVAAPRGSDQTTGNSTLESVANSVNEPVVAIGGQTASNQQTAHPQQLTSGGGQRDYKAEPGDSVSKMAAKFYGRNTRTNRQLIIDANPSLKQAPDRVIVGSTYVIPSAASTPAANPPKLTDNVVVVEDPNRASAQPTRAAVAATSEHFYTVKSGDTLTKIAIEQLGTPNAVSAIVELNKLPDANTIHPNMKLRLPAKPVTVAQSP